MTSMRGLVERLQRAFYIFGFLDDRYDDAGRVLIWNSRNLPTRISQGSTVVDFSYNPDGARYQQIKTVNGTATTTLYIGGLYEQVTQNGTVTHKNYLSAAGRTLAIRETTHGTHTLKYLHQDHLGSTDVVTNSSGQVLERSSFDAFGSRRNSNWTDPVSALTSLFTTRGYTGHEQLDEIGLIHMNGRVYDPALGRFLSADPYVKYPEGAQGLNRYSYVDNNPLSRVDPSGFGWLSKTWKKIKKWARPIAAAVAAYFTAGWAYTAYMTSAISAAGGAMAISGAQFAAASFTGSVIGGAAGGFVGGFVGSGGSIKAAAIGAVSGGIAGSVAGYFGNNYSLGRVGVEGISEGTIAHLNGGKFKDGFKSGALLSSLTYSAVRLREYELTHSRQVRGQVGESPGVFGLSGKLGGERINVDTWKKTFGSVFDPLSPTFNADLEKYLSLPGGPLGGHQGGEGRLFFWNYPPGSFRDYLVESFSGVHDFMNHPWFYNKNGTSHDFLGGSLGKVGYYMGETVSGINVVPSAFIVSAAAVPSNVRWNLTARY